MTTLIDRALLDEVSAAAHASPRKRKNRNFHAADDHPAHRLLNGIEPGTYIPPHRHMDPAKAETMVVLRGAMGYVGFDEGGAVTAVARLAAGGDACGVDIATGQYHAILALEPGTVFLEAKAGPYLPLTEAERAPWAPLENSPEAAAYLDGLVALFKPD